jgi:murein DD-endopeptidase MepM/ murein hydrolase activator NlpD
LRKSTDGATRLAETARTSRTRMPLPARLNRRAVMTARSAKAWIGRTAASPAASLRAALVTALRPITTAERALPLAVAAIVAVAALLGVMPSSPAGAVGGVQGRGQDVRLAAVNAGTERSSGPVDVAALDARLGEDTSFAPIVIPDDVSVTAAAEEQVADTGSFLDDGTLVTGYAPETTVEDASGLLVKYKVKSGDTLSSIANKFDVSMMTLWWANEIKSKDDLHIGQVLRIPPVSGLVITVKETDTLESLAKEHDAKVSRIKAVNQLEDDTLVVGQVLMIPGAKGEPIPTPKPTPKAKAAKSRVASSHHASSGRTGGSYGGKYSGGSMRWPVIGGGNYVSQYFHYGHYAIDIAADYGSPVVATASGRVYFAGWKSNGGGWQVWISHGSGIYTTYNHMSAVSVGAGQWVGKGQRVGRLGQSGWATGPHLHFEVWAGGVPWSGGHQVNPMRYL